MGNIVSESYQCAAYVLANSNTLACLERLSKVPIGQVQENLAEIASWVVLSVLKKITSY
jgi:hypothetical protein